MRPSLPQLSLGAALAALLLAAPAARGATPPGKLPSVVELYNLVHAGQPVAQKDGAWTVALASGPLPATVDLPNGYLAFGEGGSEPRGAAALFVTADQRALLADYLDSGASAELRFYEYREGKAPPVAQALIPRLDGAALLVPGQDARPLAEHDVFDVLPFKYELPRVGTTIVATLATEFVRMNIGMSRRPDAAKDQLYPFVEKSLYDRVELKFDAKKGAFTVGKKSRSAK